MPKKMKVSTGIKALANLRILQYLQKHSDEEHKVTQKEIIEYLSREHNIEVDRKTVKRDITNLCIAGYQIVETKNGCYLEDNGDVDFDESEIRYLIESVLFSRHIPEKQADALINKIKKLGNVYYEDTFGKVHKAKAVNRTDSQEFLFNISCINEAIKDDKNITFYYNDYGTDKKLKKLFNEKITAIPMEIVAKNDNFHVVAKPTYCKDIINYRIDKITDIEVTELKAKSTDKIDINKYMSAHPSMMIGEGEEILFRAPKQIIGEIIDSFGKNFEIISESEFSVTVKLFANIPDMEEWAKKFGDVVEIISPQKLRNKMRLFGKDVYAKYFKSEDDRYSEALKEGKNNKSLIFCNLDLSDKNEFKDMTATESLRLNKNGLEDVSFLENFYALKDLRIEDNPVKDVSAIKHCRKLESLSLKNTQVSDISCITCLDNLRELELSCNKIEDFSPIYNMFGLRELKLKVKDAVLLDVDKLKFDCPHLALTLTDFSADMGLEDCFTTIGQMTEEQQGKFIKISDIFDKESIKNRSFFTKEDIKAALCFVKENKEFTTAQFQRYMTEINYSDLNKKGKKFYPYSQARSILDWLMETGELSYDKTDAVYYNYKKRDN